MAEYQLYLTASVTVGVCVIGAVHFVLAYLLCLVSVFSFVISSVVLPHVHVLSQSSKTATEVGKDGMTEKSDSLTASTVANNALSGGIVQCSEPSVSTGTRASSPTVPSDGHIAPPPVASPSRLLVFIDRLARLVYSAIIIPLVHDPDRTRFIRTALFLCINPLTLWCTVLLFISYGDSNASKEAVDSLSDGFATVCAYLCRVAYPLIPLFFSRSTLYHASLYFSSSFL